MQTNTVAQLNVPVVMGSNQETRFGQILLRLGKISPADIDNILSTQKEYDVKFGEAALKLSLINEANIRQVLAIQFGDTYLQAGQRQFSPELIAISQPYAPQVESLRALRSQLMMRWFGEGKQSLAIVAANAGEGCSYLAANLAIVFAQLGQRTLLIDANLRDSRQHHLFDLKANAGLSDVLAGRADLNVATQVEPFDHLVLLCAGTVPPNPQELLSRATFSDLLKQAEAQYDVVLVDTMPAAMSADAQATVAKCGAALLVSRLNHTRLSDLAMVRDQVAVTGAQIVGSVINDF